MACTNLLGTISTISCTPTVSASVYGCPIECNTQGNYRLTIVFPPVPFGYFVSGLLQGSDGSCHAISPINIPSAGGTVLQVLNLTPGVTYTVTFYYDQGFGCPTTGVSCSNGLCKTCQYTSFTIPPITVSAPITILGTDIVDATCSVNGQINVVVTPTGIYWYELLDAIGNSLVPPIGPTQRNANSYSFLNLPPAQYTVKVCGDFQGLPSACNCKTIILTVSRTCILQAVNCVTGAILLIDGAQYPAETPIILNKVIKTTFAGYPEDCWAISESQGIPNTLLPAYSVFNDCTICENTICGNMLNTIIGVDVICGVPGSATVTPTTGKAPFTYFWSNGGFTQTITGLTPGFYDVNYLDANECPGYAFIIINDIPCPKCYLVTPCDTSIQPFYISNPDVSDEGSPPDTNPDHFLNNIFTGTITLPGTISIPPVTLTGCFKIETTQCNNTPVQGVTIDILFYSYPDCISGCPGPCWKVIRCDDTGIFYYVQGDLSFLTGKIFNNIIISDGLSPAFNIQGILPNQCWYVELSDPCNSSMILSQTGTIFPDCDCCKTKCK